ncbi:hypothetical protein AB0C24_23745 [Amycolatopsis japonica]|uniref:hypothetical protein n=1 Tax=Amycolatopsis japonica TaxID=208439 RepID=UPI0033E4DB31
MKVYQRALAAFIAAVFGVSICQGPVRSAEAAGLTSVPVTSLPLLPGGQAKDGLAPGRTDADFWPVAGNDRTSSSFDVRRSSVIRRTQYTQEYRNPDGTVTERRSATPLNMQDVTGQWQPIDTSWRPRADGRLGTAKHPLDPTFAADSADPTLVQAGVGAARVSFALEGVAASKRTTDGETVSYPGVRPGVDIRARPSTPWLPTRNSSGCRCSLRDCRPHPGPAGEGGPGAGYPSTLPNHLADLRPAPAREAPRPPGGTTVTGSSASPIPPHRPVWAYLRARK